MNSTSWTVTSPSGTLEMVVTHDVALGTLEYTVSDDGYPVLAPSRLGLKRADSDFSGGFRTVRAMPVTVIEDDYELVHGKTREVKTQANELVLTAMNSDGLRLEIVTRAYDHAVAFRYRFPENGDESTVAKILGEATSFNLAHDGQAWIQESQPASIHAPAYENLHRCGVDIGSPSAGPGWNLPALFLVGTRWVLLTESDLDGTYFGAHLGPEPIGGEYTVVLPDPLDGNGVGETAAICDLPWAGPWRVVIVAQDLGPIVETTAPQDLSRAGELADDSWIRPGRVAWSWWSDTDSPKDLKTLRTYVDFAAEIGWEHVLVDANWHIHPERELRDLVAYAASKSVGVFLWYNSGGPHNEVTEQPRDRMADPVIRRAEMARFAAWGGAGVKVDFFQSDKQTGIRLIEAIVQDAAEARLMVNLHGCTIPRGWTRRWPHLMTHEAVPGAEQYIFDANFPAAAPRNNAILPFTRNVIGPMDYTPVTFSDNVYPHLTTTAHELALATIFESSLQHFADSAESYQSQHPAVVAILRAVPAIWDETRLIEGYPGEFVAMGRRRDKTWFVAGINGADTDRSLSVDLSFITGHAYQALAVMDGAGRDEVTVAEWQLDPSAAYPVTMRSFGGFSVMLRPSS